MHKPTQNCSYLENISLLKAKLVTFRGTKVVNSYCFHPELEVKPDARRSMWLDVPPQQQNTEERQGWAQRASTLKQPVQKHAHCQTLHRDKWTERTRMRMCVGLKEREKLVGGRQGWQFLSQCALIEGNAAMWETGKSKKWWEDDEKNGLLKTSPHQRAGPAYYK